MQNAKIITEDQVTVFLDGQPHFYRKDDTSNGERVWAKVVEMLREDRLSDAVDVMQNGVEVDALDALNNLEENEFITFDTETRTLYLDGTAIPQEMAQRINDIFEAQDQDFTALSAFFGNLLQNPDRTSIEELFEFLIKNNLPLTDDGHFLAYKIVSPDYKDIYTGEVDNSVGATPAMKRQFVDSNRSNTCSSGYHFCSIEYVKRMGGSYGRHSNPLMVLKVNPKDVVSIPLDYNFSKGRCSDYEVVSEIPADQKAKLFGYSTHQNNFWGSSVVSDDELDDYDDEVGELVDEEEFLEEANSRTFDAMLQEAKNNAPKTFMVSNGINVDDSVVEAILNLVVSIPQTTMANVREVMTVFKLPENDRLARRVTEKLKDQGVLEGVSGAWSTTGVQPTYTS